MFFDSLGLPQPLNALVGSALGYNSDPDFGPEAGLVHREFMESGKSSEMVATTDGGHKADAEIQKQKSKI